VDNITDLSMVLPRCPHEDHPGMALRPIKSQTYEQKHCGVWYDCQYPGCSCSVLLPSPEIRNLYGM
jgi:hypothetical protein